MFRLVPSLVVYGLLVAGAVADEGIGVLSDWPLWGVAFLNFFLTGWLLGWLLARLTPGWSPPAFVWKWFDFLTRPADRERGVDA